MDDAGQTQIKSSLIQGCVGAGGCWFGQTGV